MSNSRSGERVDLASAAPIIGGILHPKHRADDRSLGGNFTKFSIADGDGEVDGHYRYPWLYDNATRYMECLGEFQKFSDEWEGVEGWIREHLAGLVEPRPQDLDRKEDWAQLPPSNFVYNMLGIGSGSGEVDAAILSVMLPFYPHVSATVVEPDGSQIDLYRQLTASHTEFSGVDFNFHQQTSDEFIMENQNKKQAFDLIHMVHVLYHIKHDELKETFSHYCKMLNPGGLMFITYESDKSTIAMIRSELQPFKPGMPSYVSILDIEKTLSQVVPSYRRHNIKGTLDVTACFLEDPSASGECLWDFITRVVGFRTTVPKEVVQWAAEMLRQMSWVDGRGRILTNIDTAVLIVQNKKVQTYSP